MAQGKLSTDVCDSSGTVDVLAAPDIVDGTTLFIGARVLIPATAFSGGVDLVYGGSGIWVVETVGTGADGVWVRALDADTSDKVTAGTRVIVRRGAVHQATVWEALSYSTNVDDYVSEQPILGDPQFGPRFLRMPGPFESELFGAIYNLIIASIQNTAPPPENSTAEGFVGSSSLYAKSDHSHPVAISAAQGKLSADVCDASGTVDVLAAPDVVDGVPLFIGARILIPVGAYYAGADMVRGGAGIWVVESVGTGPDGIWVRALDADVSAKVTVGTRVIVLSGAVYGSTSWEVYAYRNEPDVPLAQPILGDPDYGPQFTAMPGPLVLGAAGLQARIAALETRLALLETALANAGLIDSSA